MTALEIATPALIKTLAGLRESPNPRQAAAAELMMLSAMALSETVNRPESAEVFVVRMQQIEQLAQTAASGQSDEPARTPGK